MSENSKVCCICLQECMYLLTLSEDGFSKSIRNIEKLQACLPNQHWEQIFNICHECIGKLDSAYGFIQLCLRSEEYRTLQIQKLNCPAEIESEFTCYECNKSFRLKRTLSLHITRIHTNPKKNSKRKLSTPTEQTEAHGVEDNKYNVKAEEAGNDIKFELETAVKTDDNIKTESIPHAAQTDSDFDDFNDFNNCSSDENVVVKKKKVYTGKKRGPKLKAPQKCQYCELEFTRSDRYVHHVRSKHTFEKPFKCDICDAKYYSQHNLNIHLRKHRNEKPFVCSVCGKCFISSNDLWQHNKIHDEVRQYACDECEKSFKTHSNLRTHKLQMHQDPGMWKYVCTVCGKKFPLNNNLIKHMRRHEGIKDFECHLCEKKFVEKIDLQSHLLSHSNERNFKCHVCFKQYKKRETLRRHLKIEHNLGNFVVKKPEKKLSCPMCPKIFAFKNKLQRHILTHTGEKPYKCTVCDKRFRDNYDRNTHLRQVHNIEPKDGPKMDIE